MKSLVALESFIEKWRDSLGFQVDPFGNATFRAAVRYQSAAVTTGHSTLVRIRRRGHDNGKIRINKEKELFLAFPHIEFSPPAEEYDFNGAESSLVIRGYSSKLGSQYTVAIVPEDDC